mgnify:CR=1 FL=1
MNYAHYEWTESEREQMAQLQMNDAMRFCLAQADKCAERYEQLFIAGEGESKAAKLAMVAYEHYCRNAKRMFEQLHCR